MAADPTAAHTLFLGLPDVVWSGVVAAITALLGTFGGVIGTNWGNAKRLNRQLEHDTEEKAKERLLAIRRELYLKAVDANVRGLAYFGSLAQVDLTAPDVSAPFQDVLAAAAQLQLVVNQSTVQFISSLVSAYGELQLKLIAKVFTIHNLRSEIDTQSTLYDNTQAEIKRVLSTMTQYNESGQHDQERFDRLTRSFELARNMAQKTAAERSELWNRKNTLHRQFLKDMLPELKQISELQIYVLVELRRELDIEGDIEIFKRIMRAQVERMEKAVCEFDRTMYGA